MKRLPIATGSPRPDGQSLPLHLLRLAIVFHCAVLLVLARDVVVRIDVAGLLEAFRVTRRLGRIRGVLPARKVRPSGSRFFASTVFFMRSFFTHRVVHGMPFACNRLGP